MHVEGSATGNANMEPLGQHLVVTAPATGELKNDPLVSIADSVFEEMNRRPQLGWKAYLHTAESQNDVTRMAVHYARLQNRIAQDLSNARDELRRILAHMLSTHGMAWAE
ncbi:MAG TPA: hypothetical protein VJB60_00480 [Candidatus Peribacterales bacterium]|nr:hypothetical protein [Candidatus Peribacterales bacterium]